MPDTVNARSSFRPMRAGTGGAILKELNAWEFVQEPVPVSYP